VVQWSGRVPDLRYVHFRRQGSEPRRSCRQARAPGLRFIIGFTVTSRFTALKINSSETSINTLDTTENYIYVYSEKSNRSSGEVVLLRHFRFLILVILFLTFGYTAISARIINVPADSSTIQSGINGASEGDTVLVARGHYYERINFYGKAILVASNFIFDNDTTTIDSTIIDADTLVLGVADTSSVVVFVSGEDSISEIRGFTMTNGQGTATRYSYVAGGAILCWNSSPTITNNVIVGNFAPAMGGGIFCRTCSSIIDGNTIMNNATDNYGGGIYCAESSAPVITKNSITANSAYRGGGIFCWENSSVTVTNNSISDNATTGDGGGIYIRNSSATIYGNTITNNCVGSGWSGGGMFCWFCSLNVCHNIIRGNSAYGAAAIRCDNSSGTIDNNLIIGNSGLFGGGINFQYASPSITNNTIIFNESVLSDGGAISFAYDASSSIKNNIIAYTLHGSGIFWGSESNPIISNNCLWNNIDGNFSVCPAGIGDTTWGTNINGTPCDSFYNIIRDPLFVDSLNDFHLQEGSPCIDAGDNSVAPDLDLDGNLRIVDGNEDDSAVLDMGAYEYQPLVGVVEHEAPVSVYDFTLFQNYPNPFNPTTIIEYRVESLESGAEAPVHTTLTIYNLLGQKVKTLVDEPKYPGTYQVAWGGKDAKGRLAASGIYFYELKTAYHVEFRKMLLLK